MKWSADSKTTRLLDAAAADGTPSWVVEELRQRFTRLEREAPPGVSDDRRDCPGEKTEKEKPVKGRIDLNVVACDITKREGGATNQSIAQVKETLRITLDLLADYPASQVLALLEAIHG
jgi:hypothetical protein